MNRCKRHQLRSPVILVLLTVILSGCAARVSYVAPEPVEVVSPYLGREDAVGMLLNQAYQALETGLLDEAIGWLSRAMRINPVEPAIYYHMAEIRIEQGDSDQARQLLVRALSLGPDQPMTQKLEALLSSLES